MKNTTFNVKKLVKDWTEENEPLGQDLGYPQCCIDAFCAQPPQILKIAVPSEGDKLRIRASFINGEYSGFIPCEKHAKQVLNNETTLADLIENRSPVLPPFPEAFPIPKEVTFKVNNND